MSKCNRCGVEILDKTERCPLCDSALEKLGKAENHYPDVGIKRRLLALISRIYLFFAILLESILVFINVKIEFQTWWCVITGLALLYVYLLLRFAILGKSGYKIKVMVLLLIALSMSIVIDFIVGYKGWALNYAVSTGILVVDVGILVLMIVNHRNFQTYLMWQILMILCSLVPFILACVGIINHPEMTWISLAASVFLFLGTVIIGDRKARVELKRRFHI